VERFISDLVKEFESGKIDRRKFCETVALAAVVYAAGESAANAAPAEGFEVIAINHLSYKMSRLSRRARLLRVGLRNGSCSRDRQWRTSKAYVRPRAGQRRNVSRRAQRRTASTSPAFVDHVCYTIPNWNEENVNTALAARGFEPTGRPGSLHINDPFDADVQFANSVEENGFR
jgi:hypothetical protein